MQSHKATYNNQLTAEPTTGASSTTTFSYNLQGRLAQSVIDGVTYGYEYNDDGVRISQSVGGVKTIYVIDDNNHTGHAQVIEEKDAVSGAVTKSYHIGHDVLAQATAAAAVAHYLLADGHGSTRALLDDANAVVQNGATPQLFAYDAFGNLLNLPGFATAIDQALTSLLYSGEQTDRTGQQYLRARYYDPASGRFNRLDPFSGNVEDPQSLHKYLYTHGDPINGIDPSGEFLDAFGRYLYFQTQNALRSASAYGFATTRLAYYQAVSTFSILLASGQNAIPRLQQVAVRLAQLPSAAGQRIAGWLSRPQIPSMLQASRNGFMRHDQIVKWWGSRATGKHVHHIVEQGIMRWTPILGRRLGLFKVGLGWRPARPIPKVSHGR